jgi:hypothetical protein
LADVASAFDKSTENLDLLTVALKDLAPHDAQIRELCRAIVDGKSSSFTELLGKNLLAKMKEK